MTDELMLSIVARQDKFQEQLELQTFDHFDSLDERTPSTRSQTVGSVKHWAFDHTELHVETF